jgi:hypothetical protein
LNYELDQYVEALREIPSSTARLKLPKGTAHHFKTDIFKRMMYYIYDDQPGEAPIALHVSAVKEIMEMNRKGIAVEDVDDFVTTEVVEEETDFAQVVGQDSLTRFDKQRKGGKGGRNRRDGRDNRDNRNRPRGGNAEGNAGAGSNAPRGEKPQQQPREGGAPQQRQQGQQQNNNRGNRPPQRQRNERRENDEGGAPHQPQNPQQNQQGPPREKREGNPRHHRGNRGPKPQGPKDAPQQP